MTQWAAGNLTPGRPPRGRRRGQRPGGPGRPRPDAGDPARHADLPVHDRLRVRDRGQTKGGWPGVDALYDEDAGVDRADPPRRQVRRRRGAGRRDPPGRPRDAPRSRLDGPAPGHLRRVPAGDLAARERGPGRGCDRRGRRLGWRPPRRHARDPTAPGRSPCTPTGTPTADATEFEKAATHRARRPPAASARSCPAPAERRRWVLIANDDATAAKVAGAPGSGRLRPRPEPTPALHRFGRGDPEQRQRIRQRDPRRVGEREARGRRSGSSASTTRASR